MKIYLLLLFTMVAPWIFISCEDEGDNHLPANQEEIPSSISPVTNLRAESTKNENEIKVEWTNPNDKKVRKVELTYHFKETINNYSQSNLPILVDVIRGTEDCYLLKVSEYAIYEIILVAIDKDGQRSTPETITASPRNPEEPQAPDLEFLERADILMTSVMNLFFGKSARDCWNTKYPNATGPYWDGDAVVWGQGAGLSGFVALREASIGVKECEAKYAGMTNRMFESINRFITTDNERQAYAVYPANGNQRFYDDNVWIGLDMAELHIQTQEQRYLDKAIMVWNYLMTGNDDVCGGGIYWREIPKYTNKHTCSTAPTAVLGCKLYQITKEKKYLDEAVKLYRWLQKYLQDPTDHLYWDNIRSSDMVVGKDKFSYNSGQPMLAACLLYKITKEEKYLTDAQQIAYSAYRKWFSLFKSEVLNEDIAIVNPGGSAWFYAVLFRGFIELYKIDKNREYVTAYEKTLKNAWLSNCHNRENNLLNHNDFRGVNIQSSWEILHEGACVEMLARLASLERDGL